MPSGTGLKEEECQPCREPPYRACPHGSRAQRAAPRAALQAGAVGFYGPTWSPSHSTPGGTCPGLAEPLPGHQGEIAPTEPCKGGHSCAPASPLCSVMPLNLSTCPSRSVDGGVGPSLERARAVEPLQGSSCRDSRSPGPGWVLSGLGVPAPAQALWVSQRILVSAYEKRRGGARGGDASKWPVSLPHSRE